MNPDQLYSELLTNPNLTLDFLDHAFGVADPVAALDTEIKSAFPGASTILTIANALNHPESRDEAVLEDCLNQLAQTSNRKYSEKTD